MRKKGQMDYPIITFVGVIFGLMIAGIIILKIFHSIQAPLSNSFGNISGGAIAQSNVNFILNTASTFWDKIIIAFFFLALLTLIISAFLIDTNPFWIVIFIFVSMLTIIFIPNVITAIDAIYDSPQFLVESSQLSFMVMLKTYFGEFLVGIMMLIGIIIFGKAFLFRNSGGNTP